MGPSPTILIVDDEKPQREGLRAALEDKFDVYLAEDAASATRLLEKEHFDVLLTDLKMPNEDGLALIRRAWHRLGPDRRQAHAAGHVGPAHRRDPAMR